MSRRFSRFIMDASQRYMVAPRLIAAIIFQESSGDPFAIRFEPAFYDKHFKNRSKKQLLGYVPIRCTLQTELVARSTSFGLMQVLGETARENGFDKEFLAELCDPQTNIDFGTKLLLKFIEKRGDLLGALLLWNPRPSYGPEVIKHMESGECDFLLI